MDKQPELTVRWRAETEQTSAGLGDPGWLTGSELAYLAGLHFEKRRKDWLLGRLTAKSLIRELLQMQLGRPVSLRSIEVGRQTSGAPLALSGDDALPWLTGQPLPVELSISHSYGAALCGAFWRPDDPSHCARLGVDLERIESRSPDLFRDYFTASEHDYRTAGIDGTCDERATMIWSAKESALKALRKGLSVDTRAVTCLPLPDGLATDTIRLEPAAAWRPLQVSCAPSLSSSVARATGRWCRRDDFVLTVVVAWTNEPASATEAV